MTCALKNSQPAIKGGNRAGRGLPREGGRGGGRVEGRIKGGGGGGVGVGVDRYALPQSSGHPAHSNSGAVKA